MLSPKTHLRPGGGLDQRLLVRRHGHVAFALEQAPRGVGHGILVHPDAVAEREAGEEGAQGHTGRVCCFWILWVLMCDSRTEWRIYIYICIYIYIYIYIHFMVSTYVDFHSHRSTRSLFDLDCSASEHTQAYQAAVEIDAKARPRDRAAAEYHVVFCQGAGLVDEEMLHLAQLLD
jgi:hypothetical protein